MGPLHLIVDKKNITITDGKASLIVISKRLMISDHFKEKVTEKEKSDPTIKAAQLAKVYAKAKAGYHKIKVGRTLSETHKDYSHFYLAIDIIERVGCSYTEFIEAQVKGLAFVEKGKGVFPKVNQLSTDGAENRILDFLRDNNISQDSNYLRDTPLNENDDYIDAWFDFQDKKATLKQMRYIKKAQKARDGEVMKKVKVEIKRLKKLKEKKV